jgi:glycosyltransferase involved in cell wall biosynthesis
MGHRAIGRPVRALTVCTDDITGGAAIAAYRLHTGLRQIGVASSMLVSSKASADCNVHEVRRGRSALALLSRRFESSRIARDIGRYRKTLSPTLELLSDDRAAGPADLVQSLLPADVYHLHWVAGFLDYGRFFGSLPLGAPLVWTLHDMNPFTGGCHYALGCHKYKDHCGACPQLGSDDPSDLTARIHARKSAALGRMRPETTMIVAPSRWMTQHAKASTLFRGFDVIHIPNGLDTDVFQPRDRKAARDLFGLPQDGKVVMAAAHYLRNHRKGFDLLTAALDMLPPKSPAVLASAGILDQSVPLGARHFPLGEIASERLIPAA